MNSHADDSGAELLATPSDADIASLQIPRHVAIIMDGNGRWAVGRGLSRTEGHRRGMESVRAAVETSRELGVGYLTLFSFSSENWSRPPLEVQFLFGLLRLFIQRDLADLNRNNVRVRVIGSRLKLTDDIRALLDHAEALTGANTGLCLVIAFNYGGRDEITRAVRRLGEDVAAGRLAPEAIDEAAITARLDTADMPDPDLVIRTSGEMRLSNFLLWQAAYSELVFLPLYWPDFDRSAYVQAVAEYSKRTRRFGGIKARRGG
ncbi:isoprenyl transferase [Kaistia dalseonensis]|uniref:Isoprenyl transferase n=1 Tax=Kaistia dalseonensis TaxID=410840 RepID=A0ABU0H0Z9_9HYPH|nr:isoprenyl transferase [Kaistia dalseonensis]MCX5493424.1 isoprenyl transferase [Kaistia dalseonensis]MDQ0435983.1 undecaprenyl diphosphate synthase [Kaistia dalseonensis]